MDNGGNTTSSGNLWHIRLMGEFAVSLGVETIRSFQTQKTASLLAYLACPPGRPRQREELAGILWPDAEFHAGRNRLSQAVAWLRRTLAPGAPRTTPILDCNRLSVTLNAHCVRVDVIAYENAAFIALNTEGDERTQLLKNAAVLYGGDLLPTLYDDWVVSKRRELQTLQVRLLRQLVHQLCSANLWEEAQHWSREAVTIDPLDDEIQLEHVRILLSSGQESKAIRHYREFEKHFTAEIGQPLPTTLESLLQQYHAATVPVQVGSSQVTDHSNRQSQLPVQLTRFVGRHKEIEDISHLLTENAARLVTITGIGGAGKTRLAIEAASHLNPQFAGGVWFVEFSELNTEGSLYSALLSALNLTVPSRPATIHEVVGQLPTTPTLLVFDNLEQVFSVIAPAIGALLTSAPNIRILCTSRQKLNIAGEYEISVPPLVTPTSHPGTPDTTDVAGIREIAGAESVQLFVDRARAVRRDFSITSENAGAIAEICEKLDGLPLAIELCAAWAQTLSPAQMLAQLSKRFQLLVSRRTDIPARHRTMQAAIEYSYLLLPLHLQSLLVTLSVFRGGCTLEAVQFVTSDHNKLDDSFDALEQITVLREHSLILAETSSNGLMRFRMLETVREFAAQQVTMAMDLQLKQRHFHYYLHLVEANVPAGSKTVPPLQLLHFEYEHDNLRAALSFASAMAARDDRYLHQAVAMTLGLQYFWELRGFAPEGQNRLEELLDLDDKRDRPSLQTDLRAASYHCIAVLARARGEFASAALSISKSIAIWREIHDERSLATSLQVSGTVAYSRMDYGSAKACLEEAHEIAIRIADNSLLASTMLNLGNIALDLQEWEQARYYYNRSLKILQRDGNAMMVSNALNNLALVARYQGDYELAESLFIESLPVSRSLSDRASIAITMLNLGTVYLLQGQHRKSFLALQEAVNVSVEIDNRRSTAWCIKQLGHLACRLSQFQTSARLLAYSETLKQELGMSFVPADPEQLDADMSIISTAIGTTNFEISWQSGRRLSLREAVTEALTLETVIANRSIL